MYTKLDIDPIAVDPDGIAESQTLGGAGDMSLDGALCDLGTAGAFDVQDAGYSAGIGGVRIAIDSAGDVSGVTFTVTGTDQDGNATTEAITGVTTTAVESTTYWQTISQIAADGAVASGTFVGPVDEVITKTIPLNWRASVGASVAITALSGTCQFDVDETFAEVQRAGASTWGWIEVQANKSADIAAILDVAASACRLKVDSYTAGAELQFEVRQSEATQ